MNIKTVLTNTIERLFELGQGVDNLVLFYPDIFNDNEIRKSVDAFYEAHQQAIKKLKNPTLSIATIGTTSSGKSTVINALIGRRIAPIEAGEMSGGILTIKHSQEHKLVIQNTESIDGEAEEYFGSDKDIYEKIRNIMFAYHRERKVRECIAPKITTFLPILPGSNPNLLGLSTELSVELIDLPGLKSIQDRDNLKIIQEQVKKAFCLVTLDYQQVDDTKRKALLDELKKVVDFLQGSTDSMIFILNKVNLQSSDDLPLSNRIDHLQKEIQEILDLKELPDILPFNAQILYYAQCAWGSVPLTEASSIDQETRLNLLRGMFNSCMNTIFQKTEKENDLQQWFLNIYNIIGRNEHIPDEQMKKIVQYALSWSGGDHLWMRFRNRIQQSFPELVLVPALLDVIQNYNALLSKVDSFATIRQIEQKEQILAAKDLIVKSRTELEQQIENIKQEFSNEVKGIIETLKSSDKPTDIASLTTDFQEKGRYGFEELIEAVDQIERQLNIEIIEPVRTAFKNDEGSLAFKEQLLTQQVIAPASIEKIAKAYDEARGKLASFSKEPGCLVKKVPQESKNEIRELEISKGRMLQLYQAMRESLSQHGEFALQGQAKKIEKALQNLAEETNQKLCSLVNEKLSALKLDKTIINDFRKNMSQELPDLPDNFFEIPNDFQEKNDTEKKYDGTRTVTKTYEEGSCFKEQKQKDEIEIIYKDVKYKELRLPNADKMAEQWLSGIKKGKDNLWSILCNWMTKYLESITSEFQSSVNDVIFSSEVILNNQLEILDKEGEMKMTIWHEFEQQKELLQIAYTQLKNDSYTEKYFQ